MFKVMSHDKRTISWWNNRKDEIDFCPTYQRKGNVWGDMDKAFLIDSIINGFDIPKIYLADFNVYSTPLNQKKLPYAVVDGKQRLESIFGFYANKFGLNSDFVYFQSPEINIAGYKYSRIRQEYPKIADDFDQFNLDVMSVIADDEEKIKDLFLRLNRSKNLNGAELRNAMKGIVPDLIRGLSDVGFFHNCTSFSNTRGQDKNVVAKLLLIEHSGEIVDTKKRNLDKLVKDGENFDKIDGIRQSAEKVLCVLETMEKIFQPKDKLLKSSGWIPLLYQLVKNNPTHHGNIRNFLESFEHERKHAITLSKQDTYLADPEMLAFESAIRNINDAGTLKFASGILEKKLRDFKVTT